MSWLLHAPGVTVFRLGPIHLTLFRAPETPTSPGYTCVTLGWCTRGYQVTRTIAELAGRRDLAITAQPRINARPLGSDEFTPTMRSR